MKREGSDHRREKKQTLAVRIAIYGSVLTLAITLAAGLAIDSITLLLDAGVNFVILVTAFMTNESVKRMRRPPDHVYNFGYAKYEPMTAAVQGGLIVMTCAISAFFALQDMIHPEDITVYGVAVTAEMITGVLAVAISWYIGKTASRTDSAVLKGSAMQWRIEAVMSFGIAAGFLSGMALHHFGHSAIAKYVDPVMALLLAVFLVRTPVKAVIHNLRELLDAAPAEHVQSAVRKVVEKFKPRSFGVSRLRSRKAGKKIFVDVCFIVKGDLSVSHVKELAEAFEGDLKEHLPDSEAVVYFEPKR